MLGWLRAKFTLLKSRPVYGHIGLCLLARRRILNINLLENYRVSDFVWLGAFMHSGIRDYRAIFTGVSPAGSGDGCSPLISFCIQRLGLHSSIMYDQLDGFLNPIDLAEGNATTYYKKD